MRQGNEAAMKAGFKGKTFALVKARERCAVLVPWATLCAIADVDNETVQKT